LCRLGVAGLLQVPVGVVEAVVDLQLRDALAASIHRDQATLKTDMHQPHQLAALLASDPLHASDLFSKEAALNDQ
jgi:hypothetical protein